MQIRLQKLLSERGIASRRKAEALIEDGFVKVNGKVAELGQKVDPTQDSIKVRGRLLPQAAPEIVTLIINKPKGVLCSHSDPFHQNTIYDLLPKKYRKQRFISAGRLDRASEGMLILTTDGKLSHRIAHPSFGVVKRYKVTIHKPIEPRHVYKFLEGIEDEGEFLKVDKIKPSESGYVLEIHLTQGRKREIRRLCEHFGYQVTKLKRYQIGKLTLRKMPVGMVKELKAKDVEALLG